VGTYEDEVMFDILDNKFLDIDVVLVKPTIEEDLEGEYY
jgi:hypothetical protein